MTDAVLTCEGLAHAFGEVQAVVDVGFEVAPGETYGLLGPNGAGKTTTISMVCGLLTADRGTVRVAGQPMSLDAVDVKRNLGLVPQDIAIYPDLTARENLAFFGRLQGMGKADLARRIDEVLEVIGLTDRAEDRAEDYSGGMKRRLNIGIGLLHEPRLLILDEPTVGVDPQSRNAILESVEHLATEGMAVLYTTHYMEEAERLCDRVGIIDHGRLCAEGTRRELVALTGAVDLVVLSGRGDLEPAAERLRTFPGVSAADVVGEEIHVNVTEAARNLPGLLSETAAAGTSVTGVQVREPDLEAVFLHLTGRALRD